ncbi:MAG: hypothetical protein M0P31_06030 [Solirubrobacteraceae bacterium]|nr:hypothetical protein [Solirubrobacteraceae bacterium]
MRSRFVVGVALAAAITVPTTASAAGTVNGGPVKVKGGYQLSVVGVDAKRDTFTVQLTDAGKRETEHHNFTFRKGVKVVVSGSRATIKGKLGRWGSVDLRLRGAKTSKDRDERSRCGDGGSSKATVRTGRLVGKLRFRMPNGKSVTVRSMRAESRAGSAAAAAARDCAEDDRVGDGGDGDGGDGKDDEPRLMLSTEHDGGRLSFVATKRSLSLSWVQPAKGRKQPADIVRSVAATGSNLLKPSDGGVTAAVKSAGTFTGAGAYRADPAIPGPLTTGTLLGSLRVKLPGVTPVTIAGEGAILMNGDE